MYFSVGSRKCIGLNLPMMELVKVKAAFRLRFQEPGTDGQMKEKEMEMFDCFSASPKGAKLVLRMME